MIDLVVNRRFWAKQFCSGFSFFHCLLFGTKRSTFLEPTWSAADLQQQQLFESNTSWNDSLMKWTMMDATYIFTIFNSPRKASSHWVSETTWHQSTRSPPLLHLVPSHKKKAIVREIHTTFIVDQCRHGFQQFRVGRQHGNLLMGTSI